MWGISLILWAICVLGYVWIVTRDRLLGDLGCEDPIGSSNYGLSAWHWWLPHTSCSYTAADVPGYGSITAHVENSPAHSGIDTPVLVVWPLIAFNGLRLGLRRGNSVRT